MAVAAAMAAQPPTPPPSGRDGSSGDADAARKTEHLPMPSRNPLPLSASQEAQVREVFNARVRQLCSEDIKAFADCARNRTFSIPFACRALSRQMNNCMMGHATQAEHDRAREEWFAGRMERARERERKERRKLEQEQFHREWWGLPARDPEAVAREEEKLRRAERVGGYRSTRAGPQGAANADPGKK